MVSTRAMLLRNCVAISCLLVSAAQGQINVTVWDERQTEEREAYPNFIGNAIAEQLGAKPGVEAVSVGLDDPEQGLPKKLLDKTDVLLWWGHARHDEVTQELTDAVVGRIKEGMGFVALHSAHWAPPFIEAMNERTRVEAKRRYPDPATEFEFVPRTPWALPRYDSAVTPLFYALKGLKGPPIVRVDLPACVFPSFREDGKPSKVTVLRPDHPVMKGVPARFEIPKTEMYDEPFHVPTPDAVLMQETWFDGGSFRSAMVWTVGEGKVIYFRPGHETYAVYEQPEVRRILENAVTWLGGR